MDFYDMTVSGLLIALIILKTKNEKLEEEISNLKLYLQKIRKDK